LLVAERLTDPCLSPEDLVITADTSFRVRALLETLPPRERSVLELRLADLSCQEIAAVLDISPPAVWSAQSRALGRLRSVMATERGEGHIDG
jgi:RNA polymerase sigma-70 factor (ECF subfamily)